MKPIFYLNPEVLFKRLTMIAILLVFLHVVCMVAWYQDLLPLNDWLYYAFFDLDEEESLGTWFSAIVLMLCGISSWLAIMLSRERNCIMLSGWLGLAIGFPLLSIDEIAGFHEFINTIITTIHWALIGSMVVLILGCLYWPFLLGLPNRTKSLMVTAGLFYIGGAIGVEMATIPYETNKQLDTLAYNLWNAVEEFFEMFGAILYIYAVLDWVDSQSSEQGVGGKQILFQCHMTRG